MHRTKEALKLLSTLLSRVAGPRHQPIFFSLARLYAKHGLNKDALVLKLPTLCCRPPDRRTWDLLKSMAEYTPVSVEQQLQTFIDETGPGHFMHVPMITEVMCKLPFGAHGSAANKALQLLKQCATQVAPERPDDLKIIVEDLRAFMSSNIPAQVSEQFPKTIESLLISYMEALTAEHTLEAWEMPGDMMKRAFSGAPPAVLLENLQRACLRLPPTAERLFWAVFRHMQSEGVALVRAWLLQHDDPDVDRVERCARHLYHQKGEHATALDLLRWAEVRNLRVCQDAAAWRALYTKILRATAEERATAKRLGALSDGGLDMTTPMLFDDGDGQPLETTSFRHYRSTLLRSKIPLRLITMTERSLLAECSEFPAGADSGDALDIETGALLADAPGLGEAAHEGRRSELTERTHRHLDLNGAQLLPGELLQHVRYGMDSDSLAPTETTPLLDREGSALHEHPLRRGGLAHGARGAIAPPLRIIGSQRFSEQQLEFALTTLDTLGLRQHVPEQIADDEAWAAFAVHLFTAYGWHQLAQHYSQPDRALLRRLLMGDKDRLAGSLRQRVGRDNGDQPDAPETPSQANEGQSDGERLEWLSAVFEDSLDGKLRADKVENSEPEAFGDGIAFEMGQRYVWQERFGGAPGAGPRWHSFVHAPGQVQAAFKLAFLQAAYQLGSPNSRPADRHTSMDAADSWPMAALRANEEALTCHKMLISDPSGALSMAMDLLEQAASGESEQDCGALQMLCGDARFALKQYSNSISHFQHWAVCGGRASVTGLPSDAVFELVCCMLHENYPAEQIIRVAEDGCSHDGVHAEGWVLLVRLLTELPDAGDALEQAGEEENQNVVNKLLMLLGSNVTNKRERDARMQRCLQEGAEGQVEVPPPTTGRKVTRRHRPGSDESGVHTEALQEFWKSLSPDVRPSLCRVRVAELHEGVLQLSTWSLNAEREGVPREGGAKPEAESGGISPADTLPMQLLAVFTDAARTDGEANAEAPPGFSWSDALCDICSLAESTTASRTNVSDLLELSAHGLFWLDKDSVTLGVAGTALPLDDGTSASGEGEVRLSAALFHAGAHPPQNTLPPISTRSRPPHNIHSHPSLHPTPYASIPPPPLQAFVDETLKHALVSALGPNASAHAKALDRLLAVEAGFDLDAAAKDMPSLELGIHITFEQMLVLVRTVAALHRHVGSLLPHARDALCEFCRRLLRKKPVRALLAAQRAVLAVLARSMLRSIRAAYGEHQQQLKKEEAARAERELLDTLAEEEAEEQKRREMEEAEAGRRRAKKKEAEAAKKKKVKDKAAEDAGAYERGDKVAEGGDFTPEQSAPHAAATADARAAEQQRRASDAAQPELEDLDLSDDDGNATREAREAAAALAVVEAEEAAQRAWESSLLAPPSPETWEVAKAGRRRKGGAEADDATPEELRAGRVGRTAQGIDGTGVLPVEEEAERDGGSSRPRRRKNKARVQGQRPSGGEGSSDEGATPTEAVDGCGAPTRTSQPAAADAVRSQGAATKRLPSGPSSSDLEYAADEADLDGTGSSGGGGTDSATGRRGRRGGKARETGLPKDGPEGSELAVPSSSSGSLNGSAGVAGSRRKNRPVAASTEDESVQIDAAAAPGLENQTGQHSCFVNVVVQTVWNVEVFRDEFQRSQPRAGASEEDRSIFLAMAEVCSMMEDAASFDASQSRAAPKATASALKEALFRLDSNFELGEMHDATEAHEALLEALHRAVEETGEGDAGGLPARANGRPPMTERSSAGGRGGEVARRDARSSGEAVLSSGDSFVKRTFAMRMRMEYSKPADPQEEQCKPVLFDQWTQYIVASELRDAVREARAGALKASPLVTVLRKEAGLEAAPDGRAAAPSRKLMLKPPRVFTLGLASDTAHASKGEISESLDGIQERCVFSTASVRCMPLSAALCWIPGVCLISSAIAHSLCPLRSPTHTSCFAFSHSLSVPCRSFTRCSLPLRLNPTSSARPTHTLSSVPAQAQPRRGVRRPRNPRFLQAARPHRLLRVALRLLLLLAGGRPMDPL
jgi:hypothetical protein